MGTKTCKLDGCETASRRWGYCVKHAKRLYTHGDPGFENPIYHGDTKSSEYMSWHAMKLRVKRNPAYAHVTICERWLIYKNFLEDMGRKPTAQHTIDRKDNDKGYSPDNCRWATKQEQNLNRRKYVHLKNK